MTVIFLRGILKALVLFGLGSFLYGMIEVAFRGYTHWTMFLLGGTLMCLLYYIYNNIGTKNIFVLAVLGCAVITCGELVVGVYANLVFSLDVWDYSSRAFNYRGQICLLFSLLWLLLSVPAAYLSRFLRQKFED